ALEERFKLLRLAALFGELLLDEQDLEPREPVELELEDGVGLLLGQLEARDELLCGVGLSFALADDLDHLVEGVEDLLEALEDVDPRLELREVELDAPGDRLVPELEELGEDLLEIEAAGRRDLRVVGGDEAGEVHLDVHRERRVLEEVRHHELRIGALL